MDEIRVKNTNYTPKNEAASFCKCELILTCCRLRKGIFLEREVGIEANTKKLSRLSSREAAQHTHHYFSSFLTKVSLCTLQAKLKND